MANIKDLLQDDLVLDDIKATDKMGVLREFAAHLKRTGKVADAEELVRVLAERESLGSTGIGDGIAIPHGKLGDIREMLVAFGRSREGVDFQSRDNKPAHLFFLLVTPLDMPGEHLKTLARISRILKNSALRDHLRNSADRLEIRRLLCEEDGKYPQR